jgi:type I restriction enzyme S subunit
MNEIKDIPKHWQVKRLGEVCDLQNGVAFKSKDYVEFSKTLVFRMSQIRPGGILDLNHNSKYLPDGFIEIYKDYRLQEADVVIAMTDMAAETRILGVPTYFKSDGRNYLLNQRVGRLFNINNEKINIHFLRYVLTAPIINRYYKSFGKGALQINLGKNDILNALIPIPPLPEQQAIVAKIEELLSDLENGKQQLQTAQQQLKVYRQSLLKAAFEGKLTKKNIKAGELPKGWKVVTLKEVCEIKRGKSKHRPRNEPSLFGGKYPFIQTGDIRNANGGYIKKFSQTYSEIGLQQSKLWAKGTLCITIAANIGETAILDLDACFPDSVVGLVCNEKLLLNKYTNYFFISHKSKLEELAPATAQKNINVDILEKVKIPLPPLKEQQRIVDELESKFTVCDNIGETISQSLQQAETLRQSILKKAFEGKLVNPAAEQRNVYSNQNSNNNQSSVGAK